MCWERLHVCSHFRQHHLGHAAIDPRNRVKAIDLSREMARLLVDFAVQLGDQLFLLGRENQKYHRSAQPDSIQLDISVRNHQTSA